jgi:hypothetical protein
MVARLAALVENKTRMSEAQSRQSIIVFEIAKQY